MLCLLTAAASAQAETACEPRPYEARYETRVASMSVVIHRSLSRDAEGVWTASGQASKLFYRVAEISRFRINAGKVQPLEYRYSVSPGGKKNEHWLFDAQGVRSALPEKVWQLPPQEGVQDKLSYQEQMSLQLRCHRERPASLHFPIPDEDEYESYDWAWQGEESLQTALGAVKTVKLLRSRSGGKRQDIIWLAPDWDYRLVQLRHIDKGEVSDTRLLSLSLNGTAVSVPKK